MASKPKPFPYIFNSQKAYKVLLYYSDVVIDMWLNDLCEEEVAIGWVISALMCGGLFISYLFHLSVGPSPANEMLGTWAGFGMFLVMGVFFGFLIAVWIGILGALKMGIGE